MMSLHTNSHIHKSESIKGPVLFVVIVVDTARGLFSSFLRGKTTIEKREREERERREREEREKRE